MTDKTYPSAFPVSNFMMNGVLLTFSTIAPAVLGIYYRLQNFIFMPL